MLPPVATGIPARPVGVALRHGVQVAARHLPRAGHSASGRRADIIPAVALLLAIATTEVTTGFVGFGAGLLLHLALLTLFLTLAAVLKNERWRALLLILALVPLLRVIDLATPLGGVLQPFWLPLTAIPFFGAVVSITNVLDFTPPSLGLQPALPECMSLECAVAMSGIGVGMIEWWILRPAPIVAWGSLPLLLLVAALLLVCTGFLETLLFQGFIQHAAGALLGSGGGILFTAGVFGLLHIGWQSPLEIVFAFGVGLYFGLVRWLTGSLLGISLGHGVAVIMLFMVLPLRLTPQLAPQALRIEGQISGRWQAHGVTVRSVEIPLQLRSGVYQWRVAAYHGGTGRSPTRRTVLQLTARARSSAGAMPGVTGSPGLLAVLALIVLLAAREIAGTSTRQWVSRWRVSLTIGVVPLLLMFAVIVAEKVIQAI